MHSILLHYEEVNRTAVQVVMSEYPLLLNRLLHAAAFLGKTQEKRREKGRH